VGGLLKRFLSWRVDLDLMRHVDRIYTMWLAGKTYCRQSLVSNLPGTDSIYDGRNLIASTILHKKALVNRIKLLNRE